MTHVRRPNRRPIPGLAELVDGGTCRRTGKIRYLDQRSAEARRVQLAARDPDRDRLETYRCAACGDWHFGHRVTR